MIDMQNTLKYYSDNEVIHEEKLKGVRRVIAERLMESYHQKIHSSIFKYIEIDRLRVFKEKIGKGSIIDHFIRAIALTLAQKNKLNATYDGIVYRVYKDINISIAIASPGGLVTPVLKNADKLTLDEFIKKKKEVIDLVLKREHKIEDLLGGTFTVNNLGSFNVDFMLPIINPPQVAILGISRICKMNITWDMSRDPNIKELIPISITCDHSVIDGIEIAEFAQILQDKVNEPEGLWK